jgi:gliding motility-associated lipoprotein GldH
MKRILYPLFIILVSLFSACDSQRVFEDNKDIAENTWKKEDTISFNFKIADTAAYNLYYDVRYSADYPFYNLFAKYFLYNKEGKLILSPKLPEDMYLFDPKTGKPFGKGIGDLYDQRISFLKYYHFPDSGQYTVKVLQYMRKEPLEGIASFGVRVEKATEEKK